MQPVLPTTRYGEATAAAGQVPTQGLSDLQSKQVQQRRAKRYSPLALSRAEQMKSDPLFLSGVEKCREVLWKSSSI